MTEKKLTIILPVYNGERYISQAINSLLNQSFTEFNLVIVDDGSSDNTVKIINEYKDKRIILHRRQHYGITSAFNFALETVETKYVARADADDIYFKDKLLKQIAFLEEHKETVLVGTDAFYMSGEGKISKIKINVPDNNSEIMTNLFKRKRAVIQSTMTARSEIVKKIGGYREGIYPEDYDLYFRISKYGGINNISEPLAVIRIHKSFSHQHLKMLIRNHKSLISEYEKHSWNKIFYKFKQDKSSFLSIYLNRMSLYHYLNGSKFVAFFILIASVLLSPIDSLKAIIHKIRKN